MNNSTPESQNWRSIISLWLSYVSVLLLSGLCVAAMVMLLVKLTGLELPDWQFPALALIIVAGLSVISLLSSAIHLRGIRQGGKALAQKIMAKPVLGKSGFGPERMLFEAVEDLAWRTSLDLPSVWVMPDESIINAFTLGRKNDIAIIVTQGSLEMLHKDELVGLIAHEFGHLAQKDLAFNMHVLASRAGLLSLDRLGRRLCASNASGKPANRLHPKYLVGLCFRVLGSPGRLAAKVLLKFLSPSRVLLADLCAIQYSRTRFGIASTLEKIIETNEHAGLDTLYSSELSHVCFHSPTKKRAPASWFSTHLSARARILAIDPEYTIKKEKIDDLGKAQVSDMPAYRRQSPPVIEPATSMKLGESGLTDKFELYVDQPVAALAVIFAMFVKKDPDTANKFYEAVAFAYQKPFSEKVKEVREALAEEIDGNITAVLDYVKPKLSDVKSENKRLMLLNLEKLIDAEGEHNLRNHALLQYIRSVLEIEFPVLTTIADAARSKATKSRVQPPGEMEDEFSLLLSLVVSASGTSPEQQEQDYRRVMKNYTQNPIPRRLPQDIVSTKDLDDAFQSLNAQSPDIRQLFVDHCSDIARSEVQRSSENNVILEILASSLHINVPGTGGFAQHEAA